MKESLKEELIKQVESLPPRLQRQVLNFARALGASRPKGLPASESLRLAGIISKEDMEAIEKAIEEDCERVDPNEW